HWHAESEFGPLSLIEEYEKSAEVHYDRIPPILEESDVMEELVEIGNATFGQKWDVERIETARARVLEIQAAHDRHAAGGPIQAHDNPTDFAARNQILSKLIELVLDSTYRQEAHSRLGYVGMKFSTPMLEKYAQILVRLQVRSRLILGTEITLG